MNGALNLYGTIRSIVQAELSCVRTAEIAKVQEIHPHADEGDTDNYACTVALRDSDIVLKHVPIATQHIGLVSIPLVGELVLVQFVGGNINSPIIVGRLYNDEDRPPVNEENKSVLHLPLAAEDADAVHVEMTSGDSRELIIKLGEGLEITLKDDDPVVEIKVDSDKATISIARDGALTVDSQSDINITGGGSINMEASGDINLSGATINLN